MNPVSKTFTAKKGKNAGSSFTIWSIGIQMDDGEWYNIKETTEEKALEALNCQKLERDYEMGDQVKIFLEAEDAASQYWRIASIAPWNQTDEVPVEEVKDEGEVLAKAEEKVEEAKKEAGVDTKETDKKYHVEPLGKTSVPAKQPDRSRGTVKDFKGTEADKYELGMAKNNAAIIFAAMMPGLEDPKKFVKDNSDYYDKLVVSLYNKGRKIREQLLGY